MTTPIDRFSDDDKTDVERRPRGARPDDEIELVEAEPVALEVGVVTDKNFGKGPKNEDAVLVDERSDTYGVLDGMGGHAAGEIASSRAAAFIREELVKMPIGIQHDGQQVADYVRSAVIQANSQLMQMAEADPTLKGMGTTCSIMHILKGPDGKPIELITVQVGDSRVYRLRGGKLERITKDHSLIQQAIDAGHPVDGRPLPPDADQIGDPEVDAKMTETQRAFVVEHRNKIVAALGYPDTRADVVRTPIEKNDEFIAISDGVGDCLTDREIEAIAQQYSGDPVRVSEALVTASQERVKAKNQAKTAGQEIDALLNRGKDDDRSAVAIRITEAHTAEIAPLGISSEVLGAWQRKSTKEIEAGIQGFHGTIETIDRGELVPVEFVSRAGGIRAAYNTAVTEDARRQILARDRMYKAALIDALAQLIAERAGGSYADDYDKADSPARAQRLLNMYEDRLQLLEDGYKALEQKAEAVTRFRWPEGADNAQIQACLAAEREHVRRRIRQAKRSLQAGGRKPGRAAGTNPSQPMA